MSKKENKVDLVYSAADYSQTGE